MRDAADYVPGELEDGPCRFEDHAKSRASLEAFKARTRWEKRYEWQGATYANCIRCASTICIELKETT